MKRMLDRLFGRDNVEELNSLLGIIHEHWLQYYKEGWALYLYISIPTISLVHLSVRFLGARSIGSRLIMSMITGMLRESILPSVIPATMFPRWQYLIKRWCISIR